MHTIPKVGDSSMRFEEIVLERLFFLRSAAGSCKDSRQTQGRQMPYCLHSDLQSYFQNKWGCHIRGLSKP